MGQQASSLVSGTSSNPNNYITATQVQSEYQPKGDYALNSSIPAAPDLTNYTQKTDFPTLIQPYVTSQLANYATTAALQQATSGLAKQSDLAALQQSVSGLPTNASLSGYAKETEVTGLQGQLSNYTPVSTFNSLQQQLQNNYVTNSNLVTAINTAVKAAMGQTVVGNATTSGTTATTPSVVVSTTTSPGAVVAATPVVTASTTSGVGPVTTASTVYSSLAFTDYSNQGDIYNQVGTPASCSAACNSISGCVGFTFNNSNNNCFFKNSTITTPSYVPVATFYYKGSTPPAAGPGYGSFANTDFAGQGDISSTNGTFAACSAQCNSITGCAGFTMDTNNNCWFKNNTVNNPTFGANKTFYYKGNPPVSGGAVDPSKFVPNNQFIKNLSGANQCLDLPNNTKGPLYPLDTWGCTTPQTLLNQNWTLKPNGNLVNQSSGLCLDIMNGNPAAGNQVGQYACSTTVNPSQIWTYNSNMTLTSAASPGNCLDTKGSVAASNNTTLAMNTCTPGAMSQKWSL